MILDVSNAQAVLRSEAAKFGGHTDTALIHLGNLLADGMGDVPVLIHNGDKLPDDLRYLNTSGVILDKSGNITAIYVNSKASVGMSGFDTGIQSVIHDLVEYSVRTEY